LQNDPAGQGVQSEVLVNLVRLEYVPGGHIGSPPATAPPEQTLPAGQSINVDDVAPIPQEYPLGHWVH